jgi:group I intron endonuclease
MGAVVVGRVYLARNTVNGKIYIGRTTHTVKHRFDQHKHDADSKRVSSPFHAAIRKYRAEAFDVGEIFVGFDKESVYSAERDLIIEFQSIDREIGYNRREGGPGGNMASDVGLKISESNKRNGVRPRLTPEQEARKIERTRQAWTGRKHTEETKKKISESRKGRGGMPGPNNPWFGKVGPRHGSVMEDHVKRALIASREKQVSIGGTVYPSVTKAAEKLGVTRGLLYSRLKRGWPGYFYLEPPSAPSSVDREVTLSCQEH